MGLWDFFRKKKQPEVKEQKITSDNLQPWLQNKKAEIEKQETSFSKTVQKRASQLIKELKEKTSALEKLDVNEKRAEQKIKLIVKENLDNYASYTNKLISNLESLNENPKKEVVEKINSFFSDFEKRSKISYEKATFLIGKELREIKDSIRVFFRDLDSILSENKSFLEEAKAVYQIEEKINKFSEIRKAESGIKISVGEYNKKIQELNNIIKIKTQEIEEIKKSGLFLSQKQKKREVEARKQALEKQISELKDLVDFKLLANFFHSFEREMAIVKQYRENFRQSFQKTKGKDLLSLLQESKLQNQEILNKVQAINKDEEEINNTTFEKTGIEDIEDDIKEIILELTSSASKKLADQKKLEKLSATSEKMLSSIKEELGKISVRLE